ncbi:MAG: ABC transporter ATP-binding protein [Actinobacteria bacterium]|nr:ABC transporter ATP-binding protein [Actinomycetota bacterium]
MSPRGPPQPAGGGTTVSDVSVARSGPSGATAPEGAERAAAVALHGVTKRFPGAGKAAEPVTAVDAIDLEIADGEFFSLLGPSGCGKTTTLRMIAGFEYPTAGSIRIFGEEVGLEPPNKRPVNTVFQSYALFPHMTVADNIAFGLQMQGVDRAETTRRVAEVIDLVQLQGREARRPKQLSGGQQQRVALARALVNHPKVLLLDEPLGALDLKLRQTMQVELKQLQERVGITFVYVTHDQEEALTMSDRIAVMDGGRLLQVGTPQAIYDRPRTRFVADFIGDTNLLTGTVVDASTARLGDGSPIRIETDRAEGSTVTVAIRPEQLGLRDPDHPRDPALDAVHGRVERLTFLGNATLYDVVADNDPTLRIRVRQGNAPGIEHFTAGDAVRVRWMPSSASALDD